MSEFWKKIARQVDATPTPASQQSPARPTGYITHDTFKKLAFAEVGEILPPEAGAEAGKIALYFREQQSPARSDKDAEDYSAHVGEDGEYLLYRGHTLVGEIKFYADADRIVKALAAKAQGSAPSSVEIATWDARQRESGYGRNAEACMLDEIADLRAALARRATAGNAAPTEAELDKMWAARFFVSQALHNVMVGNQSAWIEWKHGAGAEAAMQWIENGLIGPGLIPSGTEAQAWFNANEDERLEVPPRPALSRLAGAAKGGATNDNSSSELASNTATAAPGDLPPLPKIYGGNYSVGELEVMLSEYGRACIASNAGAAPGWIDTDERLPPDHTDVIVLYWPYDNRENERVAGSAHHVGGTFYDEDGNDMHAPSHWMLLEIPAAPSNSPAGAKEKE